MKTTPATGVAPRLGATLLAALLAATLSVRQASAFVTTSSLGLDDAITSLIRDDESRLGTVGIYVVDAETGRVLVDRNGDKAMIPASNNKLRTTAAALHLLGPDFRFTTDLMTTAVPAGGRLPGALIVRGGGDPTISGRFQADKSDITHTLREFAGALKAKGIREVDGGILLDASYFDREYFHSGWYKDERGEWYEAEIWGLTFNDNCVDLKWSSMGQNPGDLATFTMNPQTDYVRLDNRVRVVAKGRPAERYYVRDDRSNDIILSGTITVDIEKVDSASIWNGPEFFGSVFRDVLTSEGITVRGTVRLLEPGEEKAALTGARLIATHKSPPLTEIVNVINRASQNLYADSLLKAMGREKAGEGSYAAGIRTVDDFFAKTGIYMEGNKLVDGSGLAAGNRVSPRQLVETIRHADKGEHHAAWRDSLPIGGTRGSLRTRFQQTTESKTLAPDIMGKTGLIGGVRSLSGIARNRAGRDIYYAIVLNGFKASGSRVIEFIDQTAVAIAASGGEPEQMQSPKALPAKAAAAR